MAGIAASTLEIARRLMPAASAEVSIRQILANEIRRRLNRYELIDRRLRHKYGMCFEEFQNRGVVEEQGYSFEIESDYCDWEMAVTGLVTLREQLAALDIEDD